jgi:hypothetical protein
MSHLDLGRNCKAVELEPVPARPIHHLAMVATWGFSIQLTPTSGSHRGHAVEVFVGRHPSASTIWRWWLREK